MQKYIQRKVLIWHGFTNHFKVLVAMASDPLRQLHVFWHNGYPLCMDSTEVGVLKEPNNVGLHPLLESREGSNLDAKGGGVLLHKTPGKTLEGQLLDQKFSGPLISPDLLQSHRPWSVFLFLYLIRCISFLDDRLKTMIIKTYVELEFNFTFLGAFPPEDFLAVCLTRAMTFRRFNQQLQYPFLKTELPFQYLLERAHTIIGRDCA